MQMDRFTWKSSPSDDLSVSVALLSAASSDSILGVSAILESSEELAALMVVLGVGKLGVGKSFERMDESVSRGGGKIFLVSQKPQDKLGGKNLQRHQATKLV